MCYRSGGMVWGKEGEKTKKGPEEDMGTYILINAPDPYIIRATISNDGVSASLTCLDVIPERRVVSAVEFL